MKTSIFNETKDYSLTNLDNYNTNFDYKAEEVIDKYISLVNEFLKFILEKIKIKNKNYSKFIIIRGYETITNIFNIILYCTKNLDLTIYHCQKAYYYYVEFIEQISNVDHILLQLNSRDATTYVYKKTLSELDHDSKKYLTPCNIENKNLIEIIDEHMKIFKNIFEFFLQFLDLNNLITNKKIFDKFKVICQKLFLNYLTMHTDIKKIYNDIDCINNDFLKKIVVSSNENTIDEYFKFISQKWK
jgi:hypothetical protein